MSVRRCWLVNLDGHVWAKIASKLQARDLARLAATCSELKAIAQRLTPKYRLVKTPIPVQDHHRLAWPELRFPGGLRGHSEPVFAVCSLAQSLIATADANGALKIWHDSTGALLQTIDNAHAGAVRVMRSAGNGFYLYSAGHDAVVRVWKIAHAPASVAEPLQLLSELRGHERSVLDIAELLPAPGRTAADCLRLASGGVAGVVLLWDIDLGPVPAERVRARMQFASSVERLAVCPQRRLLAVASNDARVTFLHMDLGTSLQAVRLPSPLTDLVFTRLGHLFGIGLDGILLYMHEQDLDVEGQDGEAHMRPVKFHRWPPRAPAEPALSLLLPCHPTDFAEVGGGPSLTTLLDHHVWVCEGKEVKLWHLNSAGTLLPVFHRSMAWPRWRAHAAARTADGRLARATGHPPVRLRVMPTVQVSELGAAVA